MQPLGYELRPFQRVTPVPLRVFPVAEKPSPAYTYTSDKHCVPVDARGSSLSLVLRNK